MRIIGWVFLISVISCSIIDRYPTKNKFVCKNRTFISIPQKINDYRLPRVGVFPVIVDKRLRVDSRYSDRLTRIISQKMLQEGVLPVVEVLNRTEILLEDEFFKGNHLTLKLCRDLGLDYAVLFYVNGSQNSMELHTKILDVNRNITVYYGQSTVTSKVPLKKAFLESTLASRDLSLDDFSQELANCVVDGILSN